VRDQSHALQILATEHWSLLATRSLSWNEVFTRSGLYLTVLSSSVVALALVAQATGFDERFTVFALVLLPVVFFVGLTTILRISQAAAEEPFLVMGMNRIRHAYLEMEPGLERYFVTSQFDDGAGLLVTFGAPKRASMHGWRATLTRSLVTTPGMLAVVNSVVLGVIAGVVLVATGSTEPVALGGGAVAFVVTLGLLMRSFAQFMMQTVASRTPEFPSPAA